MSNHDLSPDAELRLQSYVMTNGTRILFIGGIVLVVLGFIVAVASESIFVFAGIGGLGISMLLMTTVTRPLDRILAQLIDLNDKFDDAESERRD